MDDGREESREIELDQARSRLAEAERVTAILEARLVHYQSALEDIRTTAANILDG